MKPCRLATLILLLLAAGCGTSKWTDTGRSATEQLLITDAMDRAVSQLDFHALAGKTCFIDTTPLRKISDSEYLVSCMRQHMFACGCIVKDNKPEADYIVEVRAGAVGTDRNDVLYGIPAVNVPTVVPVSGIPSQIPEMPIVKKTDQKGVVKLSLFAYNQKTGRPIWQSGAVPEESNAKAVWVLGAGPFQRGSIYDGMEFAGDKLDMPLVDIYQSSDNRVSVAHEKFFPQLEEKIAPEEKVETAVASSNDEKPAAKQAKNAQKKPDSVVPAGHAEPSEKKKPTPPASNDELPKAAVKQAEQTTTPVNSQKPLNLPSGDLAPALSSLAVPSVPRLLQASEPPPGMTPPKQIDAGMLSTPKLIIPE